LVASDARLDLAAQEKNDIREGRTGFLAWMDKQREAARAQPRLSRK
jgi:hypothetical protein